ncbi:MULTISPECIES: hypothetical protein [unclassified Maridesulfovibrio]|uniref:hypothetical protein n=1 Tax=unclassified Maridesulfovibrio TaxID=2794999 RepID=UPI003B3C9ECA
MTDLILKALKDLLEEQIKGDSKKNIAPLLAEKQGHEVLQPLKVYENFIPSKDNDEVAYPCLVVRWVEAEEVDGFAVEVFDVLVCTYSESGRSISEEWGNVIAGRVRSILRQTTRLYKLPGANAWKFTRIGKIQAINPKLNLDERHFTHHHLTIRSSWQYPLPDITSMEG